MSVLTILPAAILDTILGRLALLFLSGTAGDMPAARDAAAEILAGYQPQTASELCLAAQIVSVRLHALEALSQAATPEMPLTRILRLRGSAVSLSRKSHKAERCLNKRQAAQRAGQPEPETIEPTPPQAEKAIALIESTRPMIQTPTPNTPPVWSKAYQQQQAARRITENLKKNAAAHNANQQVKTTPDSTPSR